MLILPIRAVMYLSKLGTVKSAPMPQTKEKTALDAISWGVFRCKHSATRVPPPFWNRQERAFLDAQVL
jgi:hypothetical protein